MPPKAHFIDNSLILPYLENGIILVLSPTQPTPVLLFYRHKKLSSLQFFDFGPERT